MLHQTKAKGVAAMFMNQEILQIRQSALKNTQDTSSETSRVRRADTLSTPYPCCALLFV